MEQPVYEDMTVKDLKQLLASRGVDYADCIEKSDLVRRARCVRLLLSPPSGALICVHSGKPHPSQQLQPVPTIPMLSLAALNAGKWRTHRTLNILSFFGTVLFRERFALCDRASFVWTAMALALTTVTSYHWHIPFCKTQTLVASAYERL